MNYLKGTPEQKELLAKMGSANKLESMEAQQAFAQFMTAPVLQAIKEADLVSNIYKDIEFDDTTNPTFPLDLYYNENYAGYLNIWSATMDDGMATNLVDVPVKELQLQTFELRSAVSFQRKHAQNGRLDVVAASMSRLAQEFVHKKNVNGWNVIMAAVATGAAKNGKAVAHGTSGAVQNVLRSSGSTLQMKDISDLMTRARRIGTSQFGGTPVNPRGIAGSDLYVSPEVMGQIREFAFNPVRTDSSSSTSNATDLPQSEREKIFSAAGAKEFFGLMIHELNELGLDKSFNSLFDTYAGSTSYTRIDGTNGSAFTGSSDEILVLIDSSTGAFRRPVAINSDSKGQLLIAPDDQFSARTKKLGFYAELNEGYLCLDGRKCTGLMLG